MISIFAALYAARLEIRRRNSFGCVCLCAFGRRNLRDCMSVFDETARDFVSSICPSLRFCVTGRAHCVCEFLCSETGSEVVGCRTRAWSGGESGLLPHPLSVWASWWLICGCSVKQKMFKMTTEVRFNLSNPVQPWFVWKLIFVSPSRPRRASTRRLFQRQGPKFDKRAKKKGNNSTKSTRKVHHFEYINSQYLC